MNADSDRRTMILDALCIDCLIRSNEPHYNLTKATLSFHISPQLATISGTLVEKAYV